MKKLIMTILLLAFTFLGANSLAFLVCNNIVSTNPSNNGTNIPIKVKQKRGYWRHKAITIYQGQCKACPSYDKKCQDGRLTIYYNHISNQKDSPQYIACKGISVNPTDTLRVKGPKPPCKNNHCIMYDRLNIFCEVKSGQ